MKALVWHGKEDVRYDTVTDPSIENPRDAIIKVTSCAICGSDLHLFHNLIPAMLPGDILGHESMGEVVEVGSDAKGSLKVGDRVVIPFTIQCGECEQCRKGNFSVCRRTNRKAELADKAFGHHTAGLFGYTHLTGGYPGGQAEYLRVPFADTTHIKVPDGIEDEKLLFLSDILPTGWQAAVQADIQPGDTVAVWGCGPVGQMTIRSAILLGAEQVIAIDHLPERLSMAEAAGAITINFEEESVIARLNELTGGEGPHKCIDAVGAEAHVSMGQPDTILDRAKQMLLAENDRPHVLREMIYACRVAGVISIIGVYTGLVDKVPMGQAMNKGLTFRMAQAHVPRWTDDLLRMIEDGRIDPSFVITHKVDLSAGPEMYRTFRDKSDSCIKVMLRP
ncbi:zinc-dependent alcohol dehydrogenase [Allosphingosinicella deserti]|uniref:Glutathione-dependent formaldehyde dehydrogenase n=1 Tax=Allosphingosinicella deserti TaxID=2116704 RepID=A0A2P7QZQ6_9SPHN|nr:zinc-dependent alcohol dehydrogenase [Sphingomonas deserti]PSJ43447.1 glutathione-dependent formaldehyde dehydrogenase [Sphingomonas deserti]